MRTPMVYNDELYGQVEIGESVLQALMDSDALKRAKGVSQHGITALLGITPPFSRFDHCVGTMLLVRRLKANINEQIAALLHDISHTAFSHVIDFVFDDHNRQSYHEDKKHEFVMDSDIPAILDRHGLNFQDYMDEEKFSLLEQPSPLLCADRLDYFLRDLVFLKLARRSEIQSALQGLAVEGGQIIVRDQDTARWLAYTFIEVDRASWSNFREVGLYQLTAEAIKAALGHGFVDEKDFWGSDDSLWTKLKSADLPEVRYWVTLITPGTRFIWNEKQPLFRVSTKVRSIDPPVSYGDSVKQLSDLDPDFARFRDDYINSKRGIWPMSVVCPPMG